MDETSRLKLPLVQAAQAQKHVTVNEALLRLDALGQLILASRSVSVPPATAAEGAVYAVATGAVDAWQGQEGLLAMFLGGGWVFLSPETGWRAWIADEGLFATFGGTGWQAGVLALSGNGASTAFEIAEFDHVLDAGAVSVTAFTIPKYALVQAVSGRIVETITGTVQSWALGVAGAADRYADGIGLARDSWIIGASGSPLTYYADTPLRLTAAGGDFAGGVVRLAVHMQTVRPPDL